MKKKLTIAALVVMLVALLLTGISIAYFTDEAEVENVFTIGDIDITLTEPSWDEDEVKDVLPGVEYAKDPIVKNVGDNPAYIRVEIKIDGYNGQTVAPSAFLMNLDKDGKFNLVTDSDGLVVLESKEALEPNGTLTVFNSVKIPAELTENDLPGDGEEFTITVTAKAIQSEGFTTATEAFDALDGETTTPPSANP